MVKFNPNKIMTHSYQFNKSLPRTRKHLNAAFVRRLKKLCGGVYRIHVTEVFGNDELGDYVYVLVSRSDEKACILSLCEAYGIGEDYIDIYPNVDDDSKEYIQVYLSQKKPYKE